MDRERETESKHSWIEIESKHSWIEIESKHSRIERGRERE